MKVWTLILFLILAGIIYHYAFVFLTNRQIVFGFMGIIVCLIVYFSLRLCFADKEK